MAEALARITEFAAGEAGGIGMIQIRADLARAGDAIAAAAGLALPEALRISRDGEGDGTRALAWMSPDELLLMLPADQVEGALADLDDALAGEHALVVDVSDMRVGFDVTGADAQDVLAKLCPVNLREIGPDGFRRTRAAQTSCAIWRIEGGWRVIGFRSVRGYLRRLLTDAARPATALAPR